MKPPPLSLILALCASISGLSAQAPEGYVLQWSDEFDYTGDPDPAVWTRETGLSGGNGEDQQYTTSLDNSRVDGNNLIIEVHQLLDGRAPRYTSARLITRDKVNVKYGRMEIRAKLPSETGTWPAIWMLSQDRLHSRYLWPDNGEIDIMEHVGYEEDPLFKQLVGKPDLENVHGTIHTFNRNGSGLGSKIFLEDASSTFHVYAINWTEDRIEWEVDGIPYFTAFKPDFDGWRVPPPEEDRWQWWPFDQRFFFILNVAVGGNWGGHFNSNNYPGTSPYGVTGVDNNGIWPQRMEVDYVRVYGPDVPTTATPIPGTVLATDLDHGPAVVIQQAQNISASHNLGNIDSGDVAEFVIEAPQSGFYPVTAWVASPGTAKELNIAIEETASRADAIQVPNTGDWQAWQAVEVGTLQLQEGRNTLQVSTTTGGFNLATLEIAAATAGTTWAGYLVDELGWTETGTWLGTLYVGDAPFVYADSLAAWMYLPESHVTENGAWIFIHKP